MASSEPNMYSQFLNLMNNKNFFEAVYESVLSPFLDSLCVVTQEKDALLYLLPCTETTAEPVWQCPSKVQRCLFSADGKNIMVILKVNSLQIYTISEKCVNLLVQIKASELTKLFHDHKYDFSSACNVKPLILNKHKMILMVDKKLLVNIEWSFVNEPRITYSLLVETHKDICISDKFIFVLNFVGLINVYDVQTGEKVLNELNFCTLSNGEKFFKLSVHSSLPLMATVNESEETVLLDINELVSDKEKIRRASLDNKKEKWTWPYKMGKTRTTSKVSNLIRTLGKVSSPLGLVVSHLGFSIRGLFAFYGILGQSKCSSFKVIDEYSGDVLYNVEGLVESEVISGGPLPLVYTDSILSVCLGVLCEDYVVLKLCNVVTDLRFSKDTGQTFISQNWQGRINFLQVFLKIILRLHLNLFRASLKTLSAKKTEEYNSAEAAFIRPKIVEKISDLFKVVMETKADCTSLDFYVRENMVVECFLHAVRLLDVVQLEQGDILDNDLFSSLLQHILTLFESVRAADPLKDDWITWREMTEAEVIREACVVGAPGLAHVFLATDRQWPANEVENKFKAEAQAFIVELIMMNDLDKANIVLRNLGWDPIKHFKWLALTTKDPLLRDILMDHLNVLGEFGTEEIEAWNFCKKVEGALSSGVKRYYVFDQRMSVSAKEMIKPLTFKLPAFQGSIDMTTVLGCNEKWRDAALTELYFNTGDVNLEKNLNKNLCWEYLVQTNQVNYLKNWIDISCDPQLLDSLVKSSDYLTKKIYNLLADWTVDEDMLNSTIHADCMNSTKTFILDAGAFHGLFATSEKNYLKKVVHRLENQSLLSSIRAVLSKPTSNVSPETFDEMIIEMCSNHSLKPVLLMCLEKPTSSKKLSASTPDFLWIDIWKSFCSWSVSTEKRKHLKDLIVKCSRFYGSGSAFESSLMEAAVALIENREISDVIVSQGEEGSLLRLTPMDMNCKAFGGSNPLKPDVTLYDLLKSTKIPVNELYLWQSQNKHGTLAPGHVDIFSEFPHFNHQVLAIKFGFRQNLDHIYYLKQGRPSFACNLFVVESLRTQRRLTTKMIKRVCGLAHGLALRRWKDVSVGNGCVSFIAMLGDIASANILRIHLGAIQCVFDYLPEDIRYYIRTLARGIAAKDSSYLYEIASILEKSIMTSSSNTKIVESMEKWYLAVSFCNNHSLTLPSLLLKELARNHDWFSFMTCMDIFKYPYEQAIELIEEINSKVLKSHLIRAVTRTTLKFSTTSPSKSPPKILLEPENNGKEDQEMGNTKEIKDIFHSFVTNIYTEVLNTIQTFTDKNIVLPWSCEQDPDADLLLTLLKCESETDTSKSLLTCSIELQSPALAVFATCFQCDNVFPNIIAWMVSSIPTSMSRIKRREEGQQVVDRVYGSKELETLLVNFFSTGYFQTFFRGMSLFMSESPITLFLNAVYHCIVLLDFETGKELLKGLTLELAHFPTKESNGFFTKTCVLNVVAKCIENLLTRSDLQNTVKRRFLRVVAESELSSLDSGFPNYLLWSQICEILECSEANLDFVQLYDLSTVTEELQNCLDVLMKNSQFTQALEICSLLSLNKDQFVLAIWKNQLDASILRNANVEKVWKDSCSAFKDENVNPKLAASFYCDMASNYVSLSSESLKNKYLALKYCLHWRRFIEDTLSASFKEESDVIELEMWKCCIQPNFDVSFLKNEDSLDVSEALLLSIWASEKVLVRSQVLEPQEKERVENLINIFLDEGDLSKALRLNAFFKSENEDLMLITSCLKITHEEVCQPDLYKMNAITSAVAPKKLWLQFQHAQEFDLSDYEVLPSKEQHQMLFFLEKLCQTVKHGKPLAHKLFVCYRLSINLDLTFKEIASERDYLSILPRSVSMTGISKFSVARDLITLANLPPLELARFLKDKIVSAIVESNSTDLAVPVTLWDVSLDHDFRLIIGLMSNPSLLGSELLQASTTLSCNHGIEVLIRAHDCFTTSCNVEGIGRVLRRARILASIALQAEQWQYLVRLLIGIERYADMSYIFQMLKDNGQFEQLLRKNMHKVPGLHLAISEFLQRYCPQDKELSKMVAAHFGLHSKLAGFWQKEAEEMISQLQVVDNTLKDTSKTRQLLSLAMENYSHAVHWFLQAGKLNRALKMGHKAQIVAVQMSLLGGPFILRLQSRADMQVLLNGSLSVAQTLIISRAYDFEPDWSTALHERWILKGDKTFFADLKSHSILSSNLISTYLNRYSLESIGGGRGKDRIKQLTISSNQNPSPLVDDFKMNNQPIK